MSDRKRCEQLQAEVDRLRTDLERAEAERQDAEKARRDMETRFHAFLDHSPAIAFLKDEQGRFTYLNRPFAQLFQQPASSLLGKTDFAIFPLEIVRKLRANDAAILATNQPLETVEQVPTPDGVSRTWLTYKFPVHEVSGHRYLGGLAIEITQRQEAEQALRRQQTLLQNIIAHIPCAVFWKDRDGVYLGCNDQSARDLGKSDPAEVIGRTDFDFQVSRDEAEFYRRCDREVMTSGRPLLDIEETQCRADGTRAILLTNKVPLYDGDAVVGVLGVYADITERKRSENLVLHRERLMRGVIETAGAVPYTRNYATGRFDYVGPGIEGLLNAPPEEFTVELWDTLVQEFFLPGHARGLAPAEARTLFLEQPSVSWYADVRVHTRSGEERWLFNAAVKIFDADGRVASSWGMLQDITQRKRLEEQLRQSQKMDAIGRLAGGVAHDFNNLLCVINGYSDLLLQSINANDPSRHLVGEIARAGERAAGLTSQLLAFSRKAIIAPKVLDLRAIVKEMHRMLRRIIGEDVELVTLADSGQGRVQADPGHVEQIILNLVVNARDAMPQGGTVTVEVRDVELDEDFAQGHPDARPGPHVLLSISDTGVGMDAPTLARIWEPFFSTKGEKGCGLGLATVYGAVQQNGGRVAVASAPGRGTSFKIYLPRLPAPPEAELSVAFRLALPRGGETLLLVEDEQAVRDLARLILESCGYVVLAAASGPEALAIAERHPGVLDLLVTDVVMPKMGGREVADRLTRRQPGLRVLFMSGYTDDAVVRHGIREHEVAFLPKPFSPSALAHKVRAVLDEPTPASPA